MPKIAHIRYCLESSRKKIAKIAHIGYCLKSSTKKIAYIETSESLSVS